MGGDEPARTLIAAALGGRQAGRDARTSTSSPITAPELEAFARRTGAALRFEAAVAGRHPGPRAARGRAGRGSGRPRPGHRQRDDELHPDRRWPTRAAAYDEVLDDAKAAGYAEADPPGDVEGDDAVNKLVILIRLAFGVWLDPADIVRRPPTPRRGARAGPGSPG